MAEALTCCAYWGARQETAEQIADRLRRFLRGLTAVSPAMFDTWYVDDPGVADYRPLRLDLDTADLVELVEAGRNRDGATVFEELGFQLVCWGSGSGPRETHLRAVVGNYSPRGGPNALVLRLGKTGSGADAGFYGSVVDVLGCVAECWEPDWGFAGNSELRSLQRPAPPGTVYVGYAQYLSPRRAEHVVGGDFGASSRETSNGGLILSLLDPEGDGVPPGSEVLEFRKRLERTGALEAISKERAVY
ncbi:hypothetical protein ADK67_34205 [Saccharothrix sp. NRRL B-16348]|uniref:Imm52 family immunity protein n=1 Tax=Saccharothrix sp. NRRL B-16348 TaxID=1415542 RepID=UPI0006AD8A4A|nr:Imm52 family immunity protein [Saccharothrix sp. NRRL B-16348]KOX19203.1 hypothetical protein ADK67_34205 [Saccharothrix sp. NRRL B-16348]